MSDPISFDSATPRLALPLLFAGQAQKEFTVNEALIRADIALHPCVLDEVGSPPGEASIGQCWIVAATASGAFAGHARAIAALTAGGWRFVAPFPGLQVYDTAAACWRRFAGPDWTMPLSPAAPSGGATVDTEARAVLVSIMEKLAVAGVFAAS